MASNSNTNEKTECCSAQMAKEQGPLIQWARAPELQGAPTRATNV